MQVTRRHIELLIRYAEIKGDIYTYNAYKLAYTLLKIGLLRYNIGDLLIGNELKYYEKAEKYFVDKGRRFDKKYK